MRDLEVVAVDDAGDPGRPGRDPGASTVERLRRWWAAALQRHPVLRTLTRWPPTPGVAAVLGAVVAGVTVALLVDRPPAPPEGPPPVPTAPLLQPESWLDVSRTDPYWFASPEREEHDRAEAARHPQEAVAVIVPTSDPIGLFALPPGAYDVRLSCTPIAGRPTAANVAVIEGEGQAIGGEVPCDGELHLLDRQLTLTDYHAFHITWHLTTEIDAVGPLDASLAVSFTAVARR